jgi:hypothetical protein
MTIEEVRQALADDKILAILRAEDTDRTERRYERQAGRKDALLEQIAARYGDPEPTPETVKAVRAASDRQVREWNIWILKADSVAALLASPPGSHRDTR